MENMNQNQTQNQTTEMSTKKVAGIAAGVFIGMSLVSAGVRRAIAFFKDRGAEATAK